MLDACDAYLRQKPANRVTIDVLAGRPLGPLTLLIIGSITMPHTDHQHSQKKKHSFCETKKIGIKCLQLHPCNTIWMRVI